MLLMWQAAGLALAQDSIMLVQGKVVQHPPLGFSDLLVVNATTGRGVFGSIDGTFEIYIRPGDEIKVSSRGFKTATVSFRDSVYRPVYRIVVELNQLLIQFDQPVVIRPQPTYKDIEESRSKIGTHRYEPLVKNYLAALSSPVTALYQLFSKKENEMQQYVALLNQQEYDNAMRNISRYMMDSGLIDLEEEEVDLFLATCPLAPEFVKNGSLYDITSALRDCFDKYKNQRRY
ncbi:MAG: hypothetical protein KatS3mg031_1632 [Chitinophagales bacterium]|nr:MAG: hypothetical protein KatS3mg031_1632 [Chitinophagales bacterium]